MVMLSFIMKHCIFHLLSLTAKEETSECWTDLRGENKRIRYWCSHWSSSTISWRFDSETFWCQGLSNSALRWAIFLKGRLCTFMYIHTFMLCGKNITCNIIGTTNWKTLPVKSFLKNSLLLTSPNLHLFDPKYSISSNIVKYLYYLK